MSFIKSKPSSAPVSEAAPRPVITFDVVILDRVNPATNVPVLERQSNFDQSLKFATELFCISGTSLEIWRRVEYPTLIGKDKENKERYNKVVVLYRSVQDPMTDKLDLNVTFDV